MKYIRTIHDLWWNRLFSFGGGYRRKFYVDATLGNDANSGLSPGQAWKTIAKVNAYTGFVSGDKILFKRGETWTGTQLTVPANNLTFADYGSGAKPIIDGDDTVNCISGNSKNNLVFTNLNVTAGLDFGFAFSAENNVRLIDCDSSACGNDNIIFNNCTDCYVSGGVSSNPYQREVGSVVSCIEINDGSDGITVDGFAGTGSAGPGISVLCHAATELPDNITVSNSSFYSNTGAGIMVGTAAAGGLCSTRKTILFDTCLSYTNTSYGIFITAADTTPPNGITFDSCKIYSNTDNAVQQTRGTNVVFSQCELTGKGSTLNLCVSERLINCTIYNASAARNALIVNGCTGFYARNNIIMNNVSGQIIIQVAGTISGWDADYNLYRRTGGTVDNTHWSYNGSSYNWANWKTNSSGDSHSPTPADPSFTNAGAGDFTLQAGSPAINAGVDVGLPYSGPAPDCGAYEHS